MKKNRQANIVTKGVMNKIVVSVVSASFLIGASGVAIASSTMVTDAIGTQELWTFEENLGVNNLTSKVNQTDGKGITKYYDANNNLTSMTDEEGRVTSYTYNATNQKVSMTEAVGTSEERITTYEYVSADIDLVTKVSKPSVYAGLLKETVTTYDTELNATSVTINGFTLSGDAVTRTISYQYDDIGRITQIDGARTDVSDTTTFTYYDCNTGAECGQLASVTNAEGHVTTHDSYDANARLTQSTDANGTVTTYTYHPRGWLLSIVQTPTQGNIRVTTYTYDNLGQLLTTTSPDGIELTYTYNAAHDLTSITDNLGNRAEYTYDAKGNRTEENVFDPDETLVRTLSTQYDVRNFVTSISEGGSITQMINDAVGKVNEQTDPNFNPNTQNNYDGLYRLQQTIDPLANNTSYQYNVADQLVQVKAPNGATTSYEYDDLGNLLKEVSSDRGELIYTHDDAGNVISINDDRGVTASYSYDALNRQISTVYPDASETITYVYDEFFVVDEFQNVNNICGIGIGRLCQITDPSGQTNYEYDAWGNVLRDTKQEASQQNDTNQDTQTYITQYSYDEANRVTQQINPNGLQIDYTRDAIGRISDISITYQGNTQNILAGRTYRADGLSTGYILGNSLQDIRQYDLQGRLTQQELVSLFTKTYSYDANGNVLAQDTTPDPVLKEKFQEDGFADPSFTYDALDRIISESSTLGSLIFTYDGNGNRLNKNRNGEDRTYSYTDPNQPEPEAPDLATILTEFEQVLIDNGIDVESRGVVLGELEGLVGDLGINPDSIQFVLNEFSTPFYTDLGITPDILDALELIMTGGAGQPETSNRLLSVNGKVIILDAIGNTLSDKDGKRQYSYNQRNQLQTFIKDGQLRGRYEYNAYNQRTSKQHTNKDGTKQRTFHYQYDRLGNLISEYKENKNAVYKLKRNYIWINTTPVAQIDFKGNGDIKHITYITTDHLNTPRIGTDETGQIVWRWDSDAFGQAQPEKDSDEDDVNRNIRLRFSRSVQRRRKWPILQLAQIL